MRPANRIWCSLALLAAGVAVTPAASGWERQWRLGGEAGYAMVALPEGSLQGLGGGAHLTYGLSDALNLRFGADVAGFDRLPPASYALLWSGTAGIEYVVDITSWVPYAGVSVGGMGVFKQAERHDIYVGMEIPAGLGYQLMPELTVGAEFRYRLLLFGTDVGPLPLLSVLGRVEYVWGD
jgi:opacity protein-like surface antigen